ncbi:hypothetical protein [Legionella sp. 31fI33]|uniref:hypothetical protein n=1 Tax=Legionella sp. 31fI33 TaxID=2886376 RepID=UPI001E5F0546|nr:hypothetical protein [Legionella sp. 31fI33]MCC5015176.1 hypothetical protein [Legionella sp. 31fI33]
MKTARQLEETMSTVHRLEEETEQLVAKHNEKVELLEAAIARKDESSAQAASDLSKSVCAIKVNWRS